jgi:hypothetical protein
MADTEKNKPEIEGTTRVIAVRWQPIETAPKDGTPILIWWPDAGFCGEPRSHYMPTEALKPGERSYKTDDPRLLWFDDARFSIGYWRPYGRWGNRNSADVYPTHWMPLPPPPTEKLKRR